MIQPWQIFIDTGGTFTDCLAIDPDGGQHRTKILSSGTLRVRTGRPTGPRRLPLAEAWRFARKLSEALRFVFMGLRTVH